MVSREFQDHLRVNEQAFESLSWHDCHVWGIEIRSGEPEEQDWTSDLAIHLDYIVGWVCGTPNTEFQVAPAILVFHGVTGPRFDIDWRDHELQVAIGPLSLDRIERELVRGQKVFLDRPYYRWRLLFNAPNAAEITFGAYGFTQTLLSEPITTRRQYLTMSERRALIGKLRG